VSQEFDLGEVEIDFISFVPRGANRKKYFLVKEDRALKEDILKSILETDEGEVSRIVKEARLEGEAAGVLEAAAKLLKAYRDELPEDALKILAKACGLPESEPVVEKNDPKNEGEGNEGPAESLSKEVIAKMDPATQAVVKQLLEENAVTKAALFYEAELLRPDHPPRCRLECPWNIAGQDGIRQGRQGDVPGQEQGRLWGFRNIRQRIDA
jgi:hypothetical protein